ncbi:MAG TPA: P-loop NTPase, partial [Acidobacteriaceae bacterium]|nr:P-loop NTPase [Acidobacteriaceae bacterium]
CHQEIDIFSKGGAERTAKQFNLPLLGSIELDGEIRQGGDTGLPVALAQAQSAKAENILEVN